MPQRSDDSENPRDHNSMLHLICNLRYSTYIRIMSCIGLELFLFAINLDVVSSSNIFNSLIYVFICKCIIVLNQ